MNPQRTIVGLMALTLLNNGLASIVKTNTKYPTRTILIGGFAVTIGLLVLSESQPNLAKAGAGLVTVASFAGPNGDALTKSVVRLTGNVAKNSGQIPKVSPPPATRIYYS